MMTRYPIEEAEDDPFEAIEITREAHNAIRAAARSGEPFKETAQKLSNGNYLVPLQASTVAAIKTRCFDGETISDCIVRITAGDRLQ